MSEITTKNINNSLINISNKLYNEGLFFANSNQITNSIESLEKSLNFNKNNIDSRNLLGLLYYYIGELGKAQKNWQLSVSISSEGNSATDYLNKLEGSSPKIANLKETINMYNQSLVYLKQNSDDMAIIQLKRIVDNNPSFLSALNLLTACYVNQDKKSLALNNINKTLEIDASNSIALDYLNKLSGDIKKVIPEKEVKYITKRKNNQNQNYSNMMGSSKGFNKSFFSLSSFIFLAVGGVLGFLIFYLFILPPNISASNKIISEKEDAILVLEDQLSLLQNNNTSLNLELENLNLKTFELENQVAIQNKKQLLVDANDLINIGNFEDASYLLYNLDTSSLDEDSLNKYNTLKENSYGKAGNNFYNSGRSKYLAREYDEAIYLFNECIKFVAIDSTQIGDSYYYLGEISLINQDETSAKNYFSLVVNDHANAYNYWTAKNKLDRLSN